MNGKAIVNGLRLGEMEAEDMLDVLHYFFEEDYRFTSQEHALISSRARRKLYKALYDKEYRYGVDDNEEVSSDGVKPYMEPTEFDPEAANPFGASLLDEPLN